MLYYKCRSFKKNFCFLYSNLIQIISEKSHIGSFHFPKKMSIFMNKLEKKLIDQLIEQSESNYPMQNAVSDCYKEFLNNNQVNELSTFIEFYENIFEISKEQVHELFSKENISININEAIRVVTAKNLFECLSANDESFLDYLKDKENQVLNQEQTQDDIIEI